MSLNAADACSAQAPVIGYRGISTGWTGCTCPSHCCQRLFLRLMQIRWVFTGGGGGSYASWQNTENEAYLQLPFGAMCVYHFFYLVTSMIVSLYCNFLQNLWLMPNRFSQWHLQTNNSQSDHLPWHRLKSLNQIPLSLQITGAVYRLTSWWYAAYPQAGVTK